MGATPAYAAWRPLDPGPACDVFSRLAALPALTKRALLRLLPEGARGYGIPSGAGLGAHPDGRIEALGMSVVCYVQRGGAVVRGEDVTI